MIIYKRVVLMIEGVIGLISRCGLGQEVAEGGS